MKRRASALVSALVRSGALIAVAAWLWITVERNAVTTAIVGAALVVATLQFVKNAFVTTAERRILLDKIGLTLLSLLVFGIALHFTRRGNVLYAILFGLVGVGTAGIVASDRFWDFVEDRTREALRDATE